MAGDWIKLRVWIARDPKVLAMSDYLAGERAFINWLTDPVRVSCKESAYEYVTRNVTRSVTVVGLLQVWGVANELGRAEGNDLVMRHANLDRLDEIADLPCFGEAMQYVGWAKEEEDDHGQLQVRFPNFLCNNVPVEDRMRSKGAERQRRFRERRQRGSQSDKDSEQESPIVSNVTRNVTERHKSNGREEKIRREDRGMNSPITPSCSEPEKPASEPTVNPPSSSLGEALITFPVVGGGGAKEWALCEGKMREYREAFPGLDLLAESRKALQWCRDNPAKRKTPRGMPAFLWRWFERAQNSGRGRSAVMPRETEAEKRERIKRERAERTKEPPAPEVATLAARLKMPRKE